MRADLLEVRDEAEPGRCQVRLAGQREQSPAIRRNVDPSARPRERNCDGFRRALCDEPLQARRAALPVHRSHDPGENAKLVADPERLEAPRTNRADERRLVYVPRRPGTESARVADSPQNEADRTAIADRVPHRTVGGVLGVA